ncbi:hypothetical protein GCM10007872_26390 [Gluconobacter sphaericus NBRC 12467]|uniref:FMN-dependent dehydrogenase domain-containing protein n=1 Tax=Gluconobacter sphaericus NBRC 12467 TaxID=1307951 RepID=A0AA37SJ13_9PROT|nr:hypothetical protein GSP01_26150 [Gluconobacter sphaericus NBRC 12467]GLQ85729.1 hypothetical protein GCM10007872_26390 [Gluconobacter sphaericus NBRC 12467]
MACRDIENLRIVWEGALAPKRLLCAEDAAQLRLIGVDGMVVSTHGGHTFNSAPAAVDTLPSLADDAGYDNDRR